MILSDEFVLLVSALAIAISKEKTGSQIELLAAIFVQLGETLNTVAVQRRILEERSEKNTCSPPGTEFLL